MALVALTAERLRDYGLNPPRLAAKSATLNAIAGSSMAQLDVKLHATATFRGAQAPYVSLEKFC
jgi:hypothetical protein